MKNLKFLLSIGLIVLISIAVAGCEKIPVELPDKELGGSVHNTQEDFSEGISVDGTEVIDGNGNWDGAITGTTGTLSGTLKVSGDLNYVENTKAVSADNTLTVAESGLTTYITTTGATTTLPAVASSDGVVFRFVVGAAFDTNNFVIDSAEGDNIEGSMIVAGAIVDCDAEDQINFIADGENVGDFVEIRSNGIKWFITQSNALSSTKLTCTDPS